MRAISSSVSSKSKTSKFSAIRSGRTDLGITTTPRWVSQRSTTWATVFPCASRSDEQGRVAEDVVPALGERAPRLDLHPVLRRNSLVLDSLVERVGLDLVHRRRHLVVDDEVHDPVAWKLLIPMARTRPSR